MFRPSSVFTRLLTVFVVSAALFGVASAGASTVAKVTKPAKGGTLALLFSAEPPGMDPIQVREVPQISPALAAVVIFDELLYADPATLKVKPKIASSLTTADKGLTWTLKLRPNVHFSDGTAYDAAAVQYNWQRIADPANKVVFAAPAQEITAYEIPDPLTLKVTLKAADPIWDQLVARNLSTLGSPTALKANPVAFQTKPVGAGPFLLKDWVRGVSMTFVRNPDYWQKGKPYLDGINVQEVSDDAARANTMLAGTAQAGLEGAWSNIQQYLATKKFALTNSPAMGGGYSIGFNMTKPPFDDVRVRQAMSLVLNSQEMVQRTGDGDGSWVINTIDEKFSPFYDQKLRLPKSDPVAAQKLIDSYVADHGGKPIEFTYLSFTTPIAVRFADAMQAIVTSNLKNVNMKIDTQSPVAGVPRQVSGDFQASLVGARWTDPALDMAQYFLTGGTQNYMRYSNPQVDAAIKTLASTVEPKAKQQAHETIISNVLKDAPIVWFMRFRTYYAYDKTRVHNFRLFYELRPLVEDIWLTNSKG